MEEKIIHIPSEQPLYTTRKMASRLFRTKKKPPVARLSYRGLFLYMAEEVRFELTVLAYTRFPSVRLKPLGHPSKNIFSILKTFYPEKGNFAIKNSVRS